MSTPRNSGKSLIHDITGNFSNNIRKARNEADALSAVVRAKSIPVGGAITPTSARSITPRGSFTGIIGISPLRGTIGTASSSLLIGTGNLGNFGQPNSTRRSKSSATLTDCNVSVLSLVSPRAEGNNRWIPRLVVRPALQRKPEFLPKNPFQKQASLLFFADGNPDDPSGSEKQREDAGTVNTRGESLGPSAGKHLGIPRASADTTSGDDDFDFEKIWSSALESVEERKFQIFGTDPEATDFENPKFTPGRVDNDGGQALKELAIVSSSDGTPSEDEPTRSIEKLACKPASDYSGSTDPSRGEKAVPETAPETLHDLARREKILRESRLVEETRHKEILLAVGKKPGLPSVSETHPELDLSPGPTRVAEIVGETDSTGEPREAGQKIARILSQEENSKAGDYIGSVDIGKRSAKLPVGAAKSRSPSPQSDRSALRTNTVSTNAEETLAALKAEASNIAAARAALSQELAVIFSKTSSKGSSNSTNGDDRNPSKATSAASEDVLEVVLRGIEKKREGRNAELLLSERQHATSEGNKNGKKAKKMDSDAFMSVGDPSPGDASPSQGSGPGGYHTPGQSPNNRKAQGGNTSESTGAKEVINTASATKDAGALPQGFQSFQQEGQHDTLSKSLQSSVQEAVDEIIKSSAHNSSHSVRQIVQNTLSSDDNEKLLETQVEKMTALIEGLVSVVKSPAATPTVYQNRIPPVSPNSTPSYKKLGSSPKSQKSSPSSRSNASPAGFSEKDANSVRLTTPVGPPPTLLRLDRDPKLGVTLNLQTAPTKFLPEKAVKNVEEAKKKLKSVSPVTGLRIRTQNNKEIESPMSLKFNPIAMEKTTDTARSRKPDSQTKFSLQGSLNNQYTNLFALKSASEVDRSQQTTSDNYLSQDSLPQFVGALDATDNQFVQGGPQGGYLRDIDNAPPNVMVGTTIPAGVLQTPLLSPVGAAGAAFGEMHILKPHVVHSFTHAKERSLERGHDELPPPVALEPMMDTLPIGAMVVPGVKPIAAMPFETPKRFQQPALHLDTKREVAPSKVPKSKKQSSKPGFNSSSPSSKPDSSTMSEGRVQQADSCATLPGVGKENLPDSSAVFPPDGLDSELKSGTVESKEDASLMSTLIEGADSPGSPRAKKDALKKRSKSALESSGAAAKKASPRVNVAVPEAADDEKKQDANDAHKRIIRKNPASSRVDSTVKKQKTEEALQASPLVDSRVLEPQVTPDTGENSPDTGEKNKSGISFTENSRQDSNAAQTTSPSGTKQTRSTIQPNLSSVVNSGTKRLLRLDSEFNRFPPRISEEITTLSTQGIDAVNTQDLRSPDSHPDAKFPMSPKSQPSLEPVTESSPRELKKLELRNDTVDHPEFKKMMGSIGYHANMLNRGGRSSQNMGSQLLSSTGLGAMRKKEDDEEEKKKQYPYFVNAAHPPVWKPMVIRDRLADILGPEWRDEVIELGLFSPKDRIDEDEAYASPIQMKRRKLLHAELLDIRPDFFYRYECRPELYDIQMERYLMESQSHHEDSPREAFEHHFEIVNPTLRVNYQRNKFGAVLQDPRIDLTEEGAKSPVCDYHANGSPKTLGERIEQRRPHGMGEPCPFFVHIEAANMEWPALDGDQSGQKVSRVKQGLRDLSTLYLARVGEKTGEKLRERLGKVVPTSSPMRGHVADIAHKLATGHNPSTSARKRSKDDMLLQSPRIIGKSTRPGSNDAKAAVADSNSAKADPQGNTNSNVSDLMCPPKEESPKLFYRESEAPGEALQDVSPSRSRRESFSRKAPLETKSSRRLSASRSPPRGQLQVQALKYQQQDIPSITNTPADSRTEGLQASRSDGRTPMHNAAIRAKTPTEVSNHIRASLATAASSAVQNRVPLSLSAQVPVQTPVIFTPHAKAAKDVGEMKRILDHIRGKDGLGASQTTVTAPSMGSKGSKDSNADPNAPPSVDPVEAHPFGTAAHPLSVAAIAKHQLKSMAKEQRRVELGMLVEEEPRSLPALKMVDFQAKIELKDHPKAPQSTLNRVSIAQFAIGPPAEVIEQQLEAQRQQMEEQQQQREQQTELGPQYMRVSPVDTNASKETIAKADVADVLRRRGHLLKQEMEEGVSKLQAITQQELKKCFHERHMQPSPRLMDPIVTLAGSNIDGTSNTAQINTSSDAANVVANVNFGQEVMMTKEAEDENKKLVLEEPVYPQIKGIGWVPEGIEQLFLDDGGHGHYLDAPDILSKVELNLPKFNAVVNESVGIDKFNTSANPDGSNLERKGSQYLSGSRVAVGTSLETYNQIKGPRKKIAPSKQKVRLSMMTSSGEQVDMLTSSARERMRLVEMQREAHQQWLAKYDLCPKVTLKMNSSGGPKINMQSFVSKTITNQLVKGERALDNPQKFFDKNMSGSPMLPLPQGLCNYVSVKTGYTPRHAPAPSAAPTHNLNYNAGRRASSAKPADRKASFKASPADVQMIKKRASMTPRQQQIANALKSGSARNNPARQGPPRSTRPGTGPSTMRRRSESSGLQPYVGSKDTDDSEGANFFNGGKNTNVKRNTSPLDGLLQKAEPRRKSLMGGRKSITGGPSPTGSKGSTGGQSGQRANFFGQQSPADSVMPPVGLQFKPLDPREALDNVFSTPSNMRKNEIVSNFVPPSRSQLSPRDNRAAMGHAIDTSKAIHHAKLLPGKPHNGGGHTTSPTRGALRDGMSPMSAASTRSEARTPGSSGTKPRQGVLASNRKRPSKPDAVPAAFAQARSNNRVNTAAAPKGRASIADPSGAKPRASVSGTRTPLIQTPNVFAKKGSKDSTTPTYSRRLELSSQKNIVPAAHAYLDWRVANCAPRQPPSVPDSWAVQCHDGFKQEVSKHLLEMQSTFSPKNVQAIKPAYGTAGMPEVNTSAVPRITSPRRTSNIPMESPKVEPAQKRMSVAQGGSAGKRKSIGPKAGAATMRSNAATTARR